MTRFTQSLLVVQSTRLVLDLGYNIQGEYEQAYPLYQRALEIDEKIFGPDNPEVATNLNNIATLLEKQVGLWRNLPISLRNGASSYVPFTPACFCCKGLCSPLFRRAGSH